jgi:hypothetical protein
MAYQRPANAAQSGYTFEEARADRRHWGRLVESTVGAPG